MTSNSKIEMKYRVWQKDNGETYQKSRMHVYDEPKGDKKHTDIQNNNINDT